MGTSLKLDSPFMVKDKHTRLGTLLFGDIAKLLTYVQAL